MTNNSKHIVIVLLIIILCMQLSEYKRKRDECKLIREMLCSTSAKAGKKAIKGSIKTYAKDMGCIFYHTGATFGNAIMTGYYSIKFPYDIYNMPDFTEIDGEPTIHNVKDNKPMTKKQKKELKEYKNKQAGDRKIK
jgi:hypothetical protein